jgi:hypothetical protein
MSQHQEEPLDCILTRIERIRSLPSAEDFSDGGRFAHLQVPFFPPVPIQILQFLYGDDVNPEQVSYRDKMEILRSLHMEINPTVMYCGCGTHILKGSTPQGLPEGVVTDLLAKKIHPFSDSDVTG